MNKHPIQPVIRDVHGTANFKANGIVQLLLDAGPFDMSQLARMQFSDEDREQFAQLVGYSVDAFSDLSYTSDWAINRANEMAVAARFADKES